MQGQRLHPQCSWARKIELYKHEEDHLGRIGRGEQEDPDDPITVRNPNHFHRDQTHKTMKLTGETRKKVSNSGLIFERSVQKNVFHAKLQQLRDPDRSPEQPEALSRGEKPLTQDELIVEVNEKSEVRWKFAGIVEQS